MATQPAEESLEALMLVHVGGATDREQIRVRTETAIAEWIARTRSKTSHRQAHEAYCAALHER